MNIIGHYLIDSLACRIFLDNVNGSIPFGKSLSISNSISCSKIPSSIKAKGCLSLNKDIL